MSNTLIITFGILIGAILVNVFFWSLCVLVDKILEVADKVEEQENKKIIEKIEKIKERDKE